MEKLKTAYSFTLRYSKITAWRKTLYLNDTVICALVSASILLCSTYNSQKNLKSHLNFGTVEMECLILLMEDTLISLINVEVGINVEGGIFCKKLSST